MRLNLLTLERTFVKSVTSRGVVRRASYFGALESGIRDSNPRHSAWEADTLPTELIPRLMLGKMSTLDLLRCQVKLRTRVTLSCLDAHV